MNLTGSPLCHLCNQSDETIPHLFIYCDKSKDFWINVKHWLYRSLKFDLCWDPNVIIFGTLNSKSVNMPINTIYISAKYFVYRYARNNRRMNIFEY